MGKRVFLCMGVMCLMALSQATAESAGRIDQTNDQDLSNIGKDAIVRTTIDDATTEGHGKVNSMELAPAIDCPCQNEPDFGEVNDSPDMPPVLQYPFNEGACAQLSYRISFGGYGTGNLIGLMIRCFGELQAYPAY